MSDFRIDIAPNGQALRFTLYKYAAGIPDAGLPFNPPPLNLAAPLIDKLRRGEALPQKFSK